MITLRYFNYHFNISLSSKSQCRYSNLIFKRFMMSAKTKITNTDTQICTKIMQIYNEYHRLEKKTPEAFYAMADQLLYLSPKIGQHFLGSFHPKKTFSIESLKEKYNIPITNPPSNMANLQDFISTSHASILQKDTYYKKAEIKVLTNSYAKEINKIQLAQTGQKNPDYLTIFYDYKAERHQDYKVTNFTVNKGHVTLLNQTDYDLRCRGIFMAYRTEYKTIIPIRDQLDAIYSEKSLSWNQRVDFAKEVLKKNLPVQSEINPSLIFKIPPNEKVDTIPIDSKYSKIFWKKKFLIVWITASSIKKLSLLKVT